MFLDKNQLDNRLKLLFEDLKEGHFSKGVLFFIDKLATFFGSTFRLTNNTQNFEFMTIQHDFLKEAFLNDAVYIYYIKKDNEFLVLTRQEKNKYFDVINRHPFIIPDKEVIKFKWDNHQFRRQEWYKYAETYITLTNIAVNTSIVESKKIIVKTHAQSPEAQEAEIKALFDPKTPVLSIRGITVGAENLPPIVSTLDLGAINSNQAWNNAITFRAIEGVRLGLPHESDNKGQEKTFSQSSVSLTTININRQQTMNNLKVFAYQVKQKWNIDLEFEETESLTIDKLESGQPNQNEEDFEDV